MLLISITICQRAYSQSDGTLDATFGTGGIVTVDNNGNTDDGNDLLLMADKSMIVGGTSFINDPDISFCSFTSTGALNTSFGNGGKFTWDIENGSKDFLNAIALDSNQQIVGTGFSYNGFNESIIVVRLHSDGTPDSTFGNNGIVKLTPAVTNEAYDVAIQPDNKIVIGGYVADGLTPVKALIIRLNEDGSYDGSFGDNGVWEGSPDPSYDVWGYSIAMQPDGKILLAGYQDVNDDDQFALGRILPGGSMDVSFTPDGWIVKNLTINNADIAHSIALQSDGKILLAGESNGEVAICRLNGDGSDDLDFADNGTFVDPLLANDDILYSIILQTDGRILAAGGGSIDDNVDFLLLRLTTDGVLDSTFNTDGIVYTNFNGSDDYAHSILLQTDNKIIAAGSAFASYWTDFAVARYGSSATGLNNNEHHPYAVVSPNPSDGNFIIHIEEFDKSEISYDVMDIAGRRLINGVLPEGDHTLSLKMNGQPAGIYFAELKSISNPMIMAREKIVIR